MFASLLIIWTIILTTYYLVKRMYESYKYPKIPGPPCIPILGNALSLWGKPESMFKRLNELSDKYPRLLGLWIGPKLHVAIFDPRDAEVILRASRHQVQKADEYYFLKPWLGDSLLISNGAKFKRNKRFILPAFNTNVLKSYLGTFNKHARQMAKNLEEFLESPEFDIHDILSKEAMNVLLETSMGVNNETLGDNAVKYAHAVETVCKIVFIRSYTLWLRPDILFQYSKLKKKQDECLKIVHGLTADVIKERKEKLKHLGQIENETGENESKKSMVLLDLLIEATQDGEKLTDQEIMDEVLTMMFAGQDTTAGTTGFALCLLGLYHRHQRRVQAELDEIFGGSDRDVTFEDICKMDYLERVILETLRLYPAIPLIGKKPIKDLKLENGLILPRNCTVGLIIMKIHRNENFYEKPHYFNPDNFLPEKIKARHPYSFIPFSAGARTCLGPRYSMLKMKVVLSHILRRYKVYSTKKEMEFILSAQTTLKRRDGFLLRIEPRERTDVIDVEDKTDKNGINVRNHLENNGLRSKEALEEKQR